MCHFLGALYPDFDTNCSLPLVTSVIHGSKKIQADPVRQKSPLCLDHLSIFISQAHFLTSYDDLLFATILSCCFYACHQTGELIQKNDKSLFDWRKIIKHSSLVFDQNHACHHLPYHKGDPFYRGTDILFMPHSVANPITLLLEYLILRDGWHGAATSLFLHENGSHPTHSWFDAKLFSFLDYSFGGHSACAGGATYYTGLGLTKDII